MAVELKQELDKLRTSYSASRPSVRLATIRQRLARLHGEPGAAKLVALLAAVEALARSLVVHAPPRPSNTAHIRYQQVRDTGPVELVEEVLRLYTARSPAELFGQPTWDLLELADQCRNLVVHECATLGHDAWPPLIEACERVLDGLVEVGGLLRAVS